jgi:hypothetical protein
MIEVYPRSSTSSFKWTVVSDGGYCLSHLNTKQNQPQDRDEKL